MFIYVIKRFILVYKEDSIYLLYFLRGTFFDLDILKYRRIFYFCKVMIIFLFQDICLILVKLYLSFLY